VSKRRTKKDWAHFMQELLDLAPCPGRKGRGGDG
jgi:hypothetical protein